MTETSVGSWSRSRQISSVVLAVLAGLLFASAFVVVWVERTVFDAEHFSRRAVLALESEPVRHAVAVELTDELASRGNQAVLAARPAAIAVVEALINTDAFQSIFADATRAAHESLLVGEGATGLDLSESLSLLANGLELREIQASPAGAVDGPGTFSTLVGRVAAFPLWERVDQVRSVASVIVPLGLISALASIGLAIDRRRGVRRIGLGLLASGAFAIGLVVLASRAVTVPVDSAPLSEAAAALVWATTADLRSAAFSAVLVGIVVMAATTRDEFTLRSAGERLSARVRSLRATTPGTLVLAAATGVAGMTTMLQPAAVTRLVVSAGALGLVFTAVRLAMDALGARRSVPGEQGVAVARSRVPTWAVALSLAIPLVAVYAVVTIDSARAAAEPELERSCQGSPDRCALRLDDVTFPGTHNSMSAAQYPATCSPSRPRRSASSCDRVYGRC